MTNPYYVEKKIKQSSKARTQATIADYPYYDWLCYKRQFKIVRYYPTMNMYLKYKYYCLAHYLLPFGAEAVNEDTAYSALLEYLRARLA